MNALTFRPVSRSTGSQNWGHDGLLQRRQDVVAAPEVGTRVGPRPNRSL
jgi:hypothetical protein